MSASPPPPPPRTRKSTGERLRESLTALTEGHGRVTAHREKSWASITFAGARHTLELVFEGAEAVEAGERFIAELPEHEFAIHGQLVAEATVAQVDHLLDPPRMAVTCEVLLLEEG